MHKCESCTKEFLTATSLFEHIQQSCLTYYKKHPESWTKILTSLSPQEDEEKAPQSSQKSTDSTPSPTTPLTVVTPPQVKTPQTVTPSTSKDPQPFITISQLNPLYTCTVCKKSFDVYKVYSDHVKECPTKKEPPFCIMFRAQNADENKPAKNVHMTVTEYFYADEFGRNVKERKIVRKNTCYSCGKTLRNNIRFMSHLRHKVINEWEKAKAGTDFNICNHCFRHYDSPFHLQCHLETVHGSEPASCTCRICELHFSSERVFLFHMKDKHVHNEMPYICRVCNYRSSYYNDVTKHFRDTHTSTTALMCPFCLTVVHQGNAFLKHALQHIKKGSDCQRCRLQFINARERGLHMANDHGSNIVQSKKKKFKNLNQRQVFVRVASLPMSPKKLMPEPALKPSEKPAETPPQPRAPKRTHNETPLKQVGVESPKSSTATSGVDLPAYLCPLKRPTKIKAVIFPNEKKFKQSSYNCWECKEAIQSTSSEFAKHFTDTYECRWCVYITSCRRAAHNHVLKEHADAEMRQQLTEGAKAKEPENFPINLDEESSDSGNSPEMGGGLEKNKEVIDTEDILPVDRKATKESSSSQKRKSPTKLSWGDKKRRKQQNPMKIQDEVKNASRGRKQRIEERVDLTGDDKDSDVEIVKAGDRQHSGGKVNPAKSGKTLRRRKILAPEGFFPDLDDDEGWARYFQQCENNKGSMKSFKQKAPAKSSLPTMVPGSVTSHTISGPFLPPLKPLRAKKPLDSTPVSSIALSLGSMVPPQVSLLGPPQKVTIPGQMRKPSDASSPTSVLTNLLQMAPVTSSTSATKPNDTVTPVYQIKFLPNNPTAAATNVANSSSLNMAPNAAVLPPQPPGGQQVLLMNKMQKLLSNVPQSPTNLRCLEVTHSSLLIRWDPPMNCLVTHYKVIFQGSGAPTVQLLPPEQTLVRLVGLKSDTMYIIRVYSLCNKTASPYSFIFQRTKKLRQDSLPEKKEKPKNDVVVVLDDKDTQQGNPEPQKYVVPADMVPQNVAMPSLSVLQNTFLSQSHDTVTVIDDEGSVPQVGGVSGIMAGGYSVTMPSLARKHKTKVQKQVDIGVEVKSHLDEETQKKRILINELLKGMKKNKQSKQKSNSKAIVDVTVPQNTMETGGTVTSDTMASNATSTSVSVVRVTVTSSQKPDAMTSQSVQMTSENVSSTTATTSSMSEVTVTSKEPDATESHVALASENAVTDNQVAVQSYGRKTICSRSFIDAENEKLEALKNLEEIMKKDAESTENGDLMSTLAQEKVNEATTGVCLTECVAPVPNETVASRPNDTVALASVDMVPDGIMTTKASVNEPKLNVDVSLKPVVALSRVQTTQKEGSEVPEVAPKEVVALINAAAQVLDRKAAENMKSVTPPKTYTWHHGTKESGGKTVEIKKTKMLQPKTRFILPKTEIATTLVLTPSQPGASVPQAITIPVTLLMTQVKNSNGTPLSTVCGDVAAVPRNNDTCAMDQEGMSQSVAMMPSNADSVSQEKDEECMQGEQCETDVDECETEVTLVNVVSLSKEAENSSSDATMPPCLGVTESKNDLESEESTEVSKTDSSKETTLEEASDNFDFSFGRDKQEERSSIEDNSKSADIKEGEIIEKAEVEVILDVQENLETKNEERKGKDGSEKNDEYPEKGKKNTLSFETEDKKVLKNDPLVTSAMEVDDANEYKMLGSSTLPPARNECSNGPTLDDIKDIMEDDLPWL